MTKYKKAPAYKKEKTAKAEKGPKGAVVNSAPVVDRINTDAKKSSEIVGDLKNLATLNKVDGCLIVVIKDGVFSSAMIANEISEVTLLKELGRYECDRILSAALNQK